MITNYPPQQILSFFLLCHNVCPLYGPEHFIMTLSDDHWEGPCGDPQVELHNHIDCVTQNWFSALDL